MKKSRISGIFLIIIEPIGKAFFATVYEHLDCLCVAQYLDVVDGFRVAFQQTNGLCMKRNAGFRHTYKRVAGGQIRLHRRNGIAIEPVTLDIQLARNRECANIALRCRDARQNSASIQAEFACRPGR